MNTDPHHWSPDYKHNLMSAAPAVVNVLRPRGDYAIIGPGGGVDVLRALANGSPSVTAIEINPDHRQRHHARPLGRLFLSPLRSARGPRSSSATDAPGCASSRQKFDVVEMTLVDTWASTAAGAFALSENNLYTVEAFREYFDHLKPDGIIAITRWEFSQPREALRVVSQELEVLKRAGISDRACALHRRLRAPARSGWCAGRGAVQEIAVHARRRSRGARPSRSVSGFARRSTRPATPRLRQPGKGAAPDNTASAR